MYKLRSSWAKRNDKTYDGSYFVEQKTLHQSNSVKNQTDHTHSSPQRVISILRDRFLDFLSKKQAKKEDFFGRNRLKRDKGGKVVFKNEVLADLVRRGGAEKGKGQKSSVFILKSQNQTPVNEVNLVEKKVFKILKNSVNDQSKSSRKVLKGLKSTHISRNSKKNSRKKEFRNGKHLLVNQDYSFDFSRNYSSLFQSKNVSLTQNSLMDLPSRNETVRKSYNIEQSLKERYTSKIYSKSRDKYLLLSNKCPLKGNKISLQPYSSNCVPSLHSTSTPGLNNDLPEVSCKSICPKSKISSKSSHRTRKRILLKHAKPHKSLVQFVPYRSTTRPSPPNFY
ncbi:unnamed protein product [Moneuplotes crassus]|uniref:Uncharacterized protein n=1 Tax=Euplotes crassus TaxID=5936 RepID=A0AAD1UCS3_EUPCR|nr:unnamed protein product [Moneuplotes crassus]